MEDGVGVNIFEDLAILLDCNIDRVDQVAVFDSHNLVVEVHEDNIFCLVLNGKLSFRVVHDVVYPVKGSSFYLFCSKIDL